MVGQAVAGRHRSRGLHLGDRQHLAVDGVLQAQQPGAGEVMVGRLHGRLGRSEVDHAVVAPRHRLGLDGAEHRPAASLVHVRVGVVADDVLVAAPAVGEQPAQVALRAAGHEQRGLLAEQRGRGLLELVDGGILSVHVVAHDGCGHSGPHGCRGLGDGVGAKVDHMIKLRSAGRGPQPRACGGRSGNWQRLVRMACILLSVPEGEWVAWGIGSVLRGWRAFCCQVLRRVAVSQTQLRNLSGSGSRGAGGRRGGRPVRLPPGR